MKKIFGLLMALAIFTTGAFAQTKKTGKKAPIKVETKKETAKPVPAVKPAPVVKPAPGTKKDGTPDMRLKENKMKKAGPTKKDGTPDMRYKENKKDPKKKA